MAPADRRSPGTEPADRRSPGTNSADRRSPGTNSADRRSPGTNSAVRRRGEAETADRRRGDSEAAARQRRASGPANALAAGRARFGAWLSRPLASFHLIVTLAALLTVLGLVMVLSASSVEAYADTGSAYALFTTQVVYALLGAVLFYIALRTPVHVMRKLALPAFVASIVMLVLVLIPGIGKESGGARRWFEFAGLSFQPSEFAKVALVLWGAHLLASRRAEHASLKELLIPLVPAGVLMAGLVVMQPNLSTTIALGIILVALLWFAGLPLRLFLSLVGAGILIAGVLAMTAGYRSARVRAFLNPGDDPQGIGYQGRQAKFSLADGGVFGRGLGQSRAKWSYLPNSHNDFIFAIIGEELGLVGCVAVIGLLALFVYAGLRIAMRSVDPFLRLLTATATTWILAQAMINIGYVIGILPVTGLQLPLVSAGGTSTAITLLMFGIVANAARHEPEAVAALNAGQDGRFARLLRLPKPEQYSPAKAAAARRAAIEKADRKRAAQRDAQRRAAQQRERRTREDQRRREEQRRHEQQRGRAEAGRRQDSRRDDPRRRQALASDQRRDRSSGRSSQDRGFPERGFRR